MSIIESIRYIRKDISRSPLTKNRGKLAAYLRVLQWQLASTILPGSYVMNWIGPSRLFLKRGVSAATSNWYLQMSEFQDMAFVLHVLKAGDWFCDIGANVGVYSVLAAKVRGANVISVEPIPETFKMLRDNVMLNDISQLTQLLNVGVAEKEGSLLFITNRGAQNRALALGEQDNDATKVPVMTLDAICADRTPVGLKIDVEGYETNVLAGATQILSRQDLLFAVIETNHTSRNFGASRDAVVELMAEQGFSMYNYDPSGRALYSIAEVGEHNTIFIRDVDAVRERISKAEKFAIDGSVF